MSVYAPLLGTLWRTLESYGVDPRGVIDEALYRPGKKSLVSQRVDSRDYHAAVAKAARLVADPAVGIRSAQFMHPSYLGALGYAWLASHDLRAALHLAERFQRMYDEETEMQVTELPDRIRVTYGTSKQSAWPDLEGDSHLANMLMLCRVNFGPELLPLQVKVKRQRPDDPSPWLDYFGTDVAFGQDEDSLSISAEDADQPLTGSNPELVAIHEEVIERYLMKLDRRNILNRIRLGLMEQLPSGRVTEDDMAKLLNMSKRTLHRKLRENDETFRTLLTQVRMDLAERYIRNRDFSITEVAFLLGYADTSSFSRAFKGWFGQSPTQLREHVDAG